MTSSFSLADCHYLVLGKGQSDPYSWTCMPKKHTSTPSTSSNAKSALVLYGKFSAISPESTNLKTPNNQNWTKGLLAYVEQVITRIFLEDLTEDIV